MFIATALKISCLLMINNSSTTDEIRNSREKSACSRKVKKIIKDGDTGTLTLCERWQLLEAERHFSEKNTKHLGRNKY